MVKPKILVFDLETSPNIGYTWGKYEQNVIEFTQEQRCLGFSYKWLGEKKVHSFMMPDSAFYTPGGMEDYYVMEALWVLINEADILIAHNGDQFDVRVMNARFIANGFVPPEPYKTIDTKKAAKRYFRFNSNKLDDLGNFFGLGRKFKHEGFDLWLKCMAGDLKAWKTMRTYAEQDVRLLEKIYLKLRPWMTVHPSLSVLTEAINSCPKCLSKKIQRRGYDITGTGKKQRYQCQDCGGWFAGKHHAVTTFA